MKNREGNPLTQPSWDNVKTVNIWKELRENKVRNIYENKASRMYIINLYLAEKVLNKGK